MAKKRLNPSIKRSRTRSGCLTCRDRHVKCDEQHPVCKNCLKSKRKCYRGIRLNFTQYTIYNPEQSASDEGQSTSNEAHMLANESKEPHSVERSGGADGDSHSHPETANKTSNRFESPAFKLLDQSITIASLYENGRQSYEPYIHLHQHEDLRESDLQFQQDICSSFSNLSAHSSYTPASSFNASSNIRSMDRSRASSSPSHQFHRQNQQNQQQNQQHQQQQQQQQRQHQQQQHQQQQQQHQQHQQQQQQQHNSTSHHQPRPQDDIHPQAWPTSFSQHDSPTRTQSQSFDNNLILENFDITKYLLQDNFIIMNQNIGPSVDDDNVHDDDINSPSPTNHASPSNPSSSQMPHVIPHDPVIAVDPQISNMIYASSEAPEISKYDVDVNKLIDLVQYQKYHWVLDLFNDLQIWKSIIPNYCLKLTEIGSRPFVGDAQHPSTGSNQNDSSPTTTEDCKLLINCLLHCYKDDLFDDFSSVLNQQLKHWNQLKGLDISRESYPAFERLLVSIVLILLNLFMRLQQRASMSQPFVIILNNQAKIFNKITAKLAFLSESNLKSVRNIILVSTLHSISMLKFFIRKQICYNLSTDEASLFEESWIVSNEKPSENEIHDPSFENYMEPLSYDEADAINNGNTKLKEFIKLNRFELGHLNSLYSNLDFPQISFKSKNETTQVMNDATSNLASALGSRMPVSVDSDIKSHASKLRQSFWYLVKSDYAIRNERESAIDIGQSSLYHEPSAIIEPKDGFKDIENNIRVSNSSNHGYSPQDSPKVKFGTPQQEQQIQKEYSSFARSLPSQSEQGDAGGDGADKNSKLVFPNERGIAIQLTREYANKIRNRANPEVVKISNDKITTILASISESKMDLDIKNQWIANFEWTLGLV